MLHWDALKLPNFRISASSLTDVVPPQWRTSIHCANAYSALASGKPLCTGVTYNDELLPQIKPCARCLSRDWLFAMCDVNNTLSAILQIKIHPNLPYIIICNIWRALSLSKGYFFLAKCLIEGSIFHNFHYLPLVFMPIDGSFSLCQIQLFWLVREKYSDVLWNYYK